MAHLTDGEPPMNSPYDSGIARVDAAIATLQAQVSAITLDLRSLTDLAPAIRQMIEWFHEERGRAKSEAEWRDGTDETVRALRRQLGEMQEAAKISAAKIEGLKLIYYGTLGLAGLLGAVSQIWKATH